MKFCYVDESGLLDGDPCFIGVGIVGDAQRIHRTRDAFQNIFSEIGGMFEANLKELKGAKLLMGRDRWRNITPEIRKSLCEGFCHWISDRKHHLVLSAIDKERYSGSLSELPEPMRKDVWVSGMAHIALQLQKAHQNQKNNKGKTLLLIDDNKRFADHLSELLFAPPEWTDSYYDRGKKQECLDQIVDSAFAVKSHHAGLVQVADLFALVFRRFAELNDYGSPEVWTGERVFISGLVEILKTRLLPVATRWPRRTKSASAMWFNAVAPASLKALS